MKKINIFLAVIASLLVFAACTDRRDNDIDIKKQNVYVKYKLEVGSALASLYDIEITYCSISGKEYTEDFKLRRTGNKWEYKEEAGNDANIHFKFVATARLKEKYELEDEEYNLSRTFSVNWYEPATKAMSFSPVDQQVENLIVSKAEIEEYLQKNPVITIVNIVERPNLKN